LQVLLLSPSSKSSKPTFQSKTVVIDRSRALFVWAENSLGYEITLSFQGRGKQNTCFFKANLNVYCANLHRGFRNAAMA